MTQKYSIEFFRDFVAKKNGLCLSTEYKNVRTKLIWQCEKGHQWTAKPYHILSGTWCLKCYEENRRIYKCDDEFFSRDTEASLYVAGFLAADGWIRHGDSYNICLQLAKKDFNQLKMIRDLMGSDARFFYSEGISPSTGNKTYSCYFNIRSKQMFYDLINRFNVVQCKTYIYVMPKWLENHPLVHHFLRGYIDGDGCFCFAQNKGEKEHVNFTMKGTVAYLTSVNNILTRNDVVEREHNIYAKRGKKYLAFDTLQYSGNGVLSRIYDFIYKDSTIFMERKRKIAEKSKEFAIYGADKRRAKKCTALQITKKDLIDKAQELKSQKKIAEYYNCTPANISWLIKDYGIRKEMDKALGKITKEEVVELFQKLGTRSAVAKKVGLTTSRVCQIIKELNNAQTN